MWQQSDDELHAIIKGSAMTYVPLSRLRRNLAVAIGNSGNRELAAVLDRPGRGVKNAARISADARCRGCCRLGAPTVVDGLMQ